MIRPAKSLRLSNTFSLKYFYSVGAFHYAAANIKFTLFTFAKREVVESIEAPVALPTVEVVLALTPALVVARHTDAARLV